MLKENLSLFYFKIIFGTRNQHLIKYECNLNANTMATNCFNDLGHFQFGANSGHISSTSGSNISAANILKSLESVYE